MSKISDKETKPEVIVRKHLFSKGYRYLKNDKRLPGKPDVVLPKYKTVIFIHGCFWHGHGCNKAKLPNTRKEFWKSKIEANKQRDLSNVIDLQNLGWKVLIIWECSLSNQIKRNNSLNDVVKQL